MQVTHSYGDKSNEMLLQFYGFVEMDNMHDIYMADLADWVQQQYKAEEGRWQFLESDPIVMQELHQARFFLTQAVHTSGCPLLRMAAVSHAAIDAVVPFAGFSSRVC